MGIDVTICLHSVTPTVPESVSFFIPLGRARSFVIVCLSLPLPLMVSYVKAKHKTQEVLLSTRQRNAVLVGWADF